MSQLIATDSQRLNLDALVELFTLDARAFGGGIMRFTPTSNGGAPLLHNGNAYMPVPIKAEGFSWTSTGTLPRPTLTLAVQDISFLSLVISSKDLLGCPVVRLRTHRKYLDDGSHPDPTATYPADHFVINKKAEETRSKLVFELTPKSDQEGRKIPALQVLRDSCMQVFRRWDVETSQWDYTNATCPYAGEAMYDINGNPTEDPLKATCGKRGSDCAAHFGATAVLPMWAFPGVGRL